MNADRKKDLLAVLVALVVAALVAFGAKGCERDAVVEPGPKVGYGGTSIFGCTDTGKRSKGCEFQIDQVYVSAGVTATIWALPVPLPATNEHLQLSLNLSVEAQSGCDAAGCKGWSIRTFDCTWNGGTCLDPSYGSSDVWVNGKLATVLADASGQIGADAGAGTITISATCPSGGPACAFGGTVSVNRILPYVGVDGGTDAADAADANDSGSDASDAAGITISTNYADGGPQVATCVGPAGGGFSCTFQCVSGSGSCASASAVTLSGSGCSGSGTSVSGTSSTVTFTMPTESAQSACSVQVTGGATSNVLANAAIVLPAAGTEYAWIASKGFSAGTWTDFVSSLALPTGAGSVTSTSFWLNGQPGITFNGTSYLSQGTFSTLSQPFTVYVIYDSSVTTTGGVITSGSASIYAEYASANQVSGYAGSFGTITQSQTADHLYTFIFNGASSSIQVDNGSATTESLGSGGLSTPFIMGNSGAGDLTGHILFALVMSGAQNSGTTAFVNTYIGGLYGIP